MMALVIGSGTTIAGCLDGENTASSDNSGTGSGSTNPGGNEPNCQMETKTHSEVVADKTETVSAGADWVFHGDREEGDVITIEVRKIGGDARPALEVEGPSGNIIANSDPSKQIRREIRVNQDGRYYIRFPNEAIVNSGMWDVRVEVETEYEEEVCY